MTHLSSRHAVQRAALGTLAALACYAAQAASAKPQEACAALLSASAPNVRIDVAEYLASGQGAQDAQSALTGASGGNSALPAHCRVQGIIEARTGADGKPYGINFELRMPDDWQGRFIFQGGGGLDGFLAPALGKIPVRGATANPALTRGYAVVSMDGGHQGLGPEFAHDQQARLDYAYAAIGKVTTQAKRLINSYYVAAPKHSYFMGCSNGGREAMLAAQRYPTEFDGVVAGNAGFHLSRAAVAEAWDTQAFMSIAPKDAKGLPVLAQAFSEADLALVSKAVLKACDKLDGIEDGLINNYHACHFKPEVLQCKAGRTSDCLQQQQVAVLKKIFDGAHDSRGDALYSSWPYDAGISSTGWRAWKLGSSADGAKPDARNVVLGSGSLSEYYMTPPVKGFDTLKFDFDKDMGRIAEIGALNDATSTYLNTFEARGGKLLVFHGLSDPVFSANDIMRWYEAVQQNTDAGDASQLKQWARLFMVPGMTHCGEGPALEDFDPLAAIQAWVEQGQAPAYMAAKGKRFPGKEQPLCPYPQTAQYMGGDANSINAYRCVAP
ncbi:tannase/feruloyl esterase family alpha/beta hydrolase [Uliginosibacterium gangwonense]|uniref:tannase/feruloyl esterase family alpha/beta hydrolase n=1 Tax=Uliginosibacterium gangwonense TaxID=392736 RepID=UPI00036EDA5E|nr:tannase/feruloyl esterase family alpha/beta hydrolase [Uliginosibacterium gangwonense]